MVARMSCAPTLYSESQCRAWYSLGLSAESPAAAQIPLEQSCLHHCVAGS